MRTRAIIGARATEPVDAGGCIWCAAAAAGGKRVDGEEALGSRERGGCTVVWSAVGWGADGGYPSRDLHDHEKGESVYVTC
jgi:hypothetical protein